MLELLKTVHGAVSKRGISSILSMVRLQKGLVIGTNGTVTIGARVEELSHLDVTTPADRFLKAMATADLSKLKIKHLDSGRLSVVAGKFRAFIPTEDNEHFPQIEPTGQLIECSGLIEALRAVAPFMGDDAIRTWSNGVLLTNDYVYATNNVSLVRYKVDMTLPSIILPRVTVLELLRIAKEPMGTITDEHSVSFILDEDVWVKSSLIDGKWPDIEKFFEDRNGMKPINPELIKAVETIAPFCPDAGLPKIFFSSEGVRTDEGSTSSEYTDIELPVGCYHADVLRTVLPLIDVVNWDRYPKACPFEGSGGKLQGLMMGMVV